MQIDAGSVDFAAEHARRCVRVVLFLAQQIVVALLQRAAAKPFAADYLSSQ
jgi:hypothetical protein